MMFLRNLDIRNEAHVQRAVDALKINSKEEIYVEFGASSPFLTCHVNRFADSFLDRHCGVKLALLCFIELPCCLINSIDAFLIHAIWKRSG